MVKYWNSSTAFAKQSFSWTLCVPPTSMLPSSPPWNSLPKISTETLQDTALVPEPHVWLNIFNITRQRHIAGEVQVKGTMVNTICTRFTKYLRGHCWWDIGRISWMAPIYLNNRRRREALSLWGWLQNLIQGHLGELFSCWQMFSSFCQVSWQPFFSSKWPDVQITKITILSWCVIWLRSFLGFFDSEFRNELGQKLTSEGEL